MRRPRGPQAAALASELRKLRIRLRELDRMLVVAVEAPTTTPDVYGVPVQAFCVLSHAAFEDYFESVCMKTADIIVDGWVLGHPSVAIASLAAATKCPLDEEDDDTTVSRSSNRRRDMATHIKRAYSHRIRENHGMDIKYLRSLLYPLGVDFDDVTLLSSVRTIARCRGDYAHTIGASRPISPEKARVLVADCLHLARVIANNLVRQLPVSAAQHTPAVSTTSQGRAGGLLSRFRIRSVIGKILPSARRGR